MTQLQPDIMIVNGANQNGHHARIIGAEGICKDLIAHQCGFLCRNRVLCKAFIDADGIPVRPDILQALNRMSRMLYILMIRCKASEKQYLYCQNPQCWNIIPKIYKGFDEKSKPPSPFRESPVW